MIVHQPRDLSIAQGVIVAFSDIIQRRIETGGRNRDGGGRHDDAVGIKLHGVAIAHDGDMPPLVLRQRGLLHDLFAAAVLDGKAQRATTGTRRQEHLLRSVVAEIEDALPPSSGD